MRFRKIPGLSGQVWQLHQVAGELYVCHQDGLFLLRGEELIKVFGSTGAWTLVPMKKTNHFLLGTYEGIYLMQLEGGRLQVIKKLKGFEETSRVIKIDSDGTIWMAHGYKGIYRLELDDAMEAFEKVQLYTEAHGFPTSLFVNLFQVKNRILFGTEKGTYRYDEEADRMIADREFMEILGNTEHIRHLSEDSDGDIWFVKGLDRQDHIGLIEFYEEEKHEVRTTPLQKLRGKLVPGFEHVNFLENSSVLFGTKDGLLIYDPQFSGHYARAYSATIYQVMLGQNDSLLYGQSPIDAQLPLANTSGEVILPFNFGEINFHYAANYYVDSEMTLFSSFLENYDQQWSSWSAMQRSHYDQLPAGHYIFRVKARNVYGVESEEMAYAFTVLPPWYFSSWMKWLYTLLTAGLLFILWRLPRKQLRLLKLLDKQAYASARERYDHERLMAERELAMLKNQKLESEIALSRTKMDALNSELASSILMITQKNNVLLRTRDQLNTVMKKTKLSNKQVLRSVIKMINVDVEAERDWKQYEVHFDQVHGNFLERLKSNFPDLTSKDLQVAAYLRLNLSSKEIAPMMNITVRSVEGCRYRLRKHLGIDSSVNLSDFILKF